jgi:hypothetical protein
MINIRNTDPQLRNSPVGLTAEMAANPYQVLEWFFYPSDHLPKYRKRLQKWLIAAVQDRNKWKRNKLVRCIYSFQGIARLLDALWIIYQRGDLLTKEETKIRGGIDEPYYHWSKRVQEAIEFEKYDEEEFDLQKITVEEEQEPHIVIKKFFENQDLFSAKEKLDFWCHTAITNAWEYTTMDKKELFEFYDQIIRVLEAVFVIVEARLLKASLAE